MKLLCYGDSNTYGYDPRSYFGGRYPSDVRWTDLLARETGLEVVNGGMNGRSIPAGGFVSLPHTDALIVMLGSNDLLNGCSAKETAARMEVFLTGIRSAYRSILLIAPPPMAWGDWVTEERLLTDSARLAEEYRAVAERLGIAFADSGQWGVELTFDGVHFSEAGHQAFFKGLLSAIDSIR